MPRYLTREIQGSVISTFQATERSFEGSWSIPYVPLLVFADSFIAAATAGRAVSHHGGPVGSGTPVEALFWGDWWLTDEGAQRANFIQSRLQAAISSEYFSELTQYGVARPSWRGSLVVTRPAPPGAFNSQEDTLSVRGLMKQLIDDDVFPDPDDEKIAFLVFMPKGFVQTIREDGAHFKGYSYEFPFDRDTFWVAWIRPFGYAPGEDPESTLRVATHELVELLSDPELDAWYVSGAEGEIADFAWSDSFRTTAQSAFVSGARVSAYWSNRHSATVIPIDRDYKAKIDGTIRQIQRDVSEGTFRPAPGDGALCAILPPCCIEDRDYSYTVSRYDELAILRASWERFQTPIFEWRVNGSLVPAGGAIAITVSADTFDGRTAVSTTVAVSLSCSVHGNILELSTNGIDANFDVTVSCSVTDGSITGNLKTNVIATPSVVIGFVGAELALDPDYLSQRAACDTAAEEMFYRQHEPVFGPRPGEPVEFGRHILTELPAYSRLREYERAKRATVIAYMAQAVLPANAAESLVADCLTFLLLKVC